MKLNIKPRKKSKPGLTISVPRFITQSGPHVFRCEGDMWIELALPLVLESKANARGHWSKRHASAAEQRGLTRMVLSTLPNSPPVDRQLDRWEEHPIRVEITRVAPRSLDGDNLVSACKSVRDGVADWLGIDDRSDSVRWGCKQRRDAPRTYGVEIKIGRWT